MSGILFGTKKVNAQSANYNLNYVLQRLTMQTVEINNDSFEIYGNSGVTDKEFRNIVNSGSPKIYLHYRTDRKIDLPYDALLEVKTESKIYSYEFVEKEANDANSILNGIKSFIRKYSDVLIGNEYYALESNVPMTLASDIPTTFIACVVEKEYVMRFSDMGYIVYHIAVSQYTVDDESIIFIVSVRNSFVPGIVAQENGESDYDKFKNRKGYVHMTVEQAYDATEEYFYGRRWGNVPYKKDYWPINNPSVVTITSSIQAGKTMGYSFKNGFSTSGISSGLDINESYNISFGYSKAITKSEPALSVQVNSSNTDKCEWNYKYANDASETYHLDTNYMFEISNSCNGLFVGDFRLKLDYSFTVMKKILFWDTEKTNTGSADLIVRAGEEQRRIYEFYSGMI